MPFHDEPGVARVMLEQPARDRRDVPVHEGGVRVAQPPSMIEKQIPLSTSDEQETRQEAGEIGRGNDGHAARSKHARKLTQEAPRILEMFENLDGHVRIEAGVLEGKGLVEVGIDERHLRFELWRVALHGGDRVPARSEARR